MSISSVDITILINEICEMEDSNIILVKIIVHAPPLLVQNSKKLLTACEKSEHTKVCLRVIVGVQ